MTTENIFCVSYDPWGDSKGGQARFAAQMLKSLGDRIAVASVTNEELPLRKWIYRSFYGNKIRFFNMGFIKNKEKKPLVPLRFLVYYYTYKSIPCIYSKGFKNIFLESPETLFAAANYKWESVCYRFAGVNNPIENSRYKWARNFGFIFEKLMFLNLKKIKNKVILASADNKSIDEMILRSNGLLERNLIHHFPTRVDTDTFRSESKEESRKELNLNINSKIFVVCGRISWIKGWDLILQSMVKIKENFDDFLLIFVGDGEERKKLIKKAKDLGLEKNYKITGFVPNKNVKNYINASDVCLVASHKEGWSLAMLEMLACGKPIVSTDVSGANDMISHGENGYVVVERDPILFAHSIIKALKLRDASKVSLKIASLYSTNSIAADLSLLWRPLRNN